jgi:hypothetical protein
MTTRQFFAPHGFVVPNSSDAELLEGRYLVGIEVLNLICAPRKSGLANPCLVG